MDQNGRGKRGIDPENIGLQSAALPYRHESLMSGTKEDNKGNSAEVEWERGVEWVDRGARARCRTVGDSDRDWFWSATESGVAKFEMAVFQRIIWL